VYRLIAVRQNSRASAKAAAPTAAAPNALVQNWLDEMPGVVKTANRQR